MMVEPTRGVSPAPALTATHRHGGTIGMATSETSTRLCSIPGCERRRKSRGWCNTHYERWRHRASKDDTARPSLQERFWPKVDKRGPGGCWIWTAAKTPLGYGAISVEGVPRRAHRISYVWSKGPIPDGLEIDHLCRVRSCVNPDHLEAVTHKENLARGYGVGAVAARTGKCHRGHQNWRVKRDGRRECRTCDNDRQRERYRTKVRGAA